jgi:Cellulase (glycosyl hydrolase family 5)
MPAGAGLRRSFVVVAVAIIGLAVAPGAMGAPAGALPPGLTVALQDDHLPVTPEENIGARIDLVAATGVRVTRVDVVWSRVAPSRPGSPADPADPAYRWSRYDRIVDALGQRGIAAIFNIYGSPSWANGGRAGQWAPDPDDYAAFMTALARRYDGVSRDAGGRVHGPVEMFQAWNEPNQNRFLLPQWERDPNGGYTAASPRIYAGLLTRAYGAVKAVQPQAWVIGAGGGPNGTDNAPGGSTGVTTFLHGLMPYHPPADAFAQHLYTALAPSESEATPSYRTLPDLIEQLDAIRPGLPILITEFGWTTRPSLLRSGFVTETRQAEYLLQAIDELSANPRVRLAVWFNLQDNADWPAGLRRANLTAKPSWTAFVQAPKFVAGGPVEVPGLDPRPGRARRAAGARAAPLSRRQQLLIDQRIVQAAIRRAQGIQDWIDAGIEGRDLRPGALGARELVAGTVTDRAGPSPAVVAPDPRPVVVPRRRPAKADRVALTARQLLINRRISQAALRRLKALKARMDGRLTGGDVKDRTLSREVFVAGLRVLAVPGVARPAAPSVTRVAPAKPGEPSEGTISVRQLRENQRISQASVRRANELIERIEGGLVASDVRDGTLTAHDLAPEIAP